jgi:hypothetical protein
LIQIALSQLAQFGQLKTKGNGQTIGAPTATERREIHRESAFRWNETKNKAALRTASRRNETKNQTVLGTSGNKTKTKTLACQSIVLSRTRQRDKRSHQRAGNKDAERCSPNDRLLENKTERETVSLDALGTRTLSAAHQTIESAAKSETGPKSGTPVKSLQ